MKRGCRVLVGAAGKDIGDLIVDGKKPLHLAWRFEAFHDGLSSSGWLMRILGPVVEAFMLTVLDTRHDLSLS
jgi:hypothetical protein